MTSSWGTTETSPMATAAHFMLEHAGSIGVPVPGVELKLVPTSNKLEIRVRGPNVTPGYWQRPDLQPAHLTPTVLHARRRRAFCRPRGPEKGVVFDGRLAENFKLTTGTWVSVGTFGSGSWPPPRRRSSMRSSPVKTGTALACLPGSTLAGGQRLAGSLAPSPSLLCHAAVRTHVEAALASWNAQHQGSSERITRILLADAPSIDANEITDKGYINQHSRWSGVTCRCRAVRGRAGPERDRRLAGAVIKEGTQWTTASPGSSFLRW